MGQVISPTLDQIACLRTPLTDGERRLLDMLSKRLSDEWEIYTQPFLNGCRPDFVLIHPRAGIGVVEVKDWSNATLINENAIGGKENPVHQIKRYAYEISTLYCPRMKSNRVGILITGALVFTKVDNEVVLSNYDRHRMSYDNHGMPVGPHISIVGSSIFDDEEIIRILPNCSKDAEARDPIEEDLLRDLRSWLIEPEYSAEQRAEVFLNPKQKQLSSKTTSNGTLRIKGPAGSGKSLVLCARAANLVKQDKSILVVSFNRTLPNYLRDVYSQQRVNPNQGVVWLVYHEWLKRVMAQEGISEVYGEGWRKYFERRAEDDSPDQLLNEDLPSKLISLGRERVADTYDAILVDEGQDFSIAALKSLRAYLRTGGEFLLVEDRFQDIYDRSEQKQDRSYSGLGFGPWFKLGGSYRLPGRLTEFLREFASHRLPVDQELLPVVPDGQLELDISPYDGRWKQVDETDFASTVVEEAFDIIRRDNKSELSVTDLTILVPSKAIGRDVVRILEKNDMGVKAVTTFAVEGESYDKDRRLKLAFRKGRPGIKVTTPHSFKGWEARLLVVGITRLRSRRDCTLFYAAMSRLKSHPKGSHLTVVSSDSGTAALGRAFSSQSD